jgi:hypothetical protein
MAALNFRNTDDAQLIVKLREAFKMVREARANGGVREHFRQRLFFEVVAECERRPCTRRRPS